MKQVIEHHCFYSAKIFTIRKEQESISFQSRQESRQ